MRHKKHWLYYRLAPACLTAALGLALAAPGLAAETPAPAATPAVESKAPAPAPAPAVSEDKLYEQLDRGEFYAAGGKFDQAQQHWNKALTMQPGWAPAQKRLAELPGRKKAYPAHMADLAVAEKRRQAQLNLIEGVDHFNAKRFGQAGEKFGQYRQVFPDDPKGKQYQALAEKFAGQR